MIIATTADTAVTAPWTRANALRIRAKAWSLYPVCAALAHVFDGRVYLWDDCACKFTSRHALSARAEKRICAAYARHVA